MSLNGNVANPFQVGALLGLKALIHQTADIWDSGFNS
jgi:hypothetical protein